MIQPQDVRARLGQEVDLRCEAEGHPAPLLAWFMLGGKESVGAGPSLHLLASPTTLGSYYCTATSPSLPSTSSRPASLSLAAPPRLLSPPTQHSVPPTLEVECRAGVEGQPSVTWSYGSLKLSSGGRYSMVESQEGQEVVWRLIIENSTTADFGVYSCSVDNDAGNSSMDIQLLEGELLRLVFTYPVKVLQAQWWLCS